MSKTDNDRYTDFLVTASASSGSGPNVTGLIYIPVTRLGDGANGPPTDGETVDIGLALTSQSFMDTLTPDSYLWVGEAANPIPSGVPSLAGGQAKVGDLIKVLDRNGDGTADALSIISPASEQSVLDAADRLVAYPRVRNVVG